MTPNRPAEMTKNVYTVLGKNFRVFFPKGKTTIARRKLSRAVAKVVHKMEGK